MQRSKKYLKKIERKNLLEQFIKEHSNKHLCECGCGQYIPIRAWCYYYLPKRILGHNCKGRKRPLSERQRIGEGNKRYYEKNGCSQERRKRISIGVKKSITTHHIDGDHTNEKAENKIRLPLLIHGALHTDAYKFIIEKGYLEDYLIWFNEKRNSNLNFTKKE
jgi:hypothetical protein